MNGASILMFILAALVFLCGLYLFITGTKSELLLWRTPNVKKMTKEEVRNVGKWTMITSGIIFIIGIVVLLLDI